MARTDKPEAIDKADSLYNSRLRGDFAGEVLGRPVNVNRPMDAELAERLFGPKPDRASYMEIPPSLPGVRVHAPGSVSLKTALNAIERSIGYAPAYFSPAIDQATEVQLPNRMLSVEQVIGVIESQAGVLINVFPEARTILVLPE
jgi:hypothetical protein